MMYKYYNCLFRWICCSSKPAWSKVWQLPATLMSVLLQWLCRNGSSIMKVLEKLSFVITISVSTVTSLQNFAFGVILTLNHMSVEYFRKDDGCVCVCVYML